MCDGFVDLQVNGFQGTNFSAPDLKPAAASEACIGILASGTAAFLPTVITSPNDVLERNLSLLADLIEDPTWQGRLLGIHLEGPFLCPKPGAIGAHNPNYCQPADPDLLRQYQEWARGHIRLLTVAADLPGADALCRAAIDMNMTVSSGHSLADEQQLAALADAGATALTHLGNGLPNQIDRHHNPIWAGLANDDYTAMIITDGHHLPPDLQRVMIRAKGVERTVVVSDASSLSGMPPGTYQGMGNDVVIEANGKLHNPKKGCLVGSSAMMLQCMNQLAGLKMLSCQELLQVGISNPLQLIGARPDDYTSPLRIQFDALQHHFSIQTSVSSV